MTERNTDNDRAVYTDSKGESFVMTVKGAMKRYAADGFKGKVTPVGAAPRAKKPATPRATMTGQAGTVSAIAVARQGKVNSALDDAVNLATGGAVTKWAHTDPVYAAGSRVNSIGVANLTAEGKAMKATGLLTDNLRKTATVIDNERRTPVDFHVQDLRLDCRDGKLFLQRRSTGKDGLPLTSDTLSHICDYYPSTFGAIKGALLTDHEDGGFTPEATAELFNRYLVDRWVELEDRGQVTSKRRGGPTVRNGHLVMWVRKQAAEWQAYTITSQRHASKGLDGAEFLRAVADTLEGAGYFGEASYNPANTKVNFNGWMMPNTVVDLSAGDVFKAGISGGTSDSKQGSYGLWLSAVRNLCLNLIILANESARILNKTHLASAESVRADLKKGLKAADGALDGLRAEWGILRGSKLTVPGDMKEAEVKKAEKMFKGTSAAVAVALMAASKTVKLPGVKRDSLVEGLLRGFNAEPGDTAADIVNAVSRMHFQKEIDSFQLGQQSGALIPILVGKAEA